MLARVTALGPDDREILVAAAWLHDIGYAPGLAETGFHPLDGARWLRTAGFGDRLAGLVAYTPAPFSRPRSAAWQRSCAVSSVMRRATCATRCGTRT
jgi:hypothetical protein